METIQALAGAIVALLVVSALAQLLMSYALQVIAEKNELPDFAAFLAWIPLLNLYPLIRCGGGSFRNFVLVAIGCVVLAGVGAAASAMVDPLVGGLVLAATLIGFVVYFARIIMNTAQSRGVSKWFGLLSFVPVVNFLVYPYIAFHDGFRAPHKIGLLIGLLVALGPIPGQLAMVEQLQQQGATALEAAKDGNLSALAEATEGSGFGEMLEQMGPTMEIASSLAALQAMDPADPQQAAAMRAQADEVRRRIAASGDGLDPDARIEFEAMLAEVDARLAGAPVAEAGDDAPPPADRVAAAATVEPVAKSPATPPLTNSIPRHGDLGYDVPVEVPCAPGAELQGGSPPQATKQWCALAGGLRHGWLTEWHDNGKPALAGEYQNGMRVGIWTRWHPNGEKRAQAEFHDGRQDGVLIAWNERGDKVHESRFEAGVPASR